MKGQGRLISKSPRPLQRFHLGLQGNVIESVLWPARGRGARPSHGNTPGFPGPPGVTFLGVESRLITATNQKLAPSVLCSAQSMADTALHSLPVLFQNKDLKSRIIHLEGSYRSSKEGLVVQLEARIVELEDRLESEER